MRIVLDTNVVASAVFFPAVGVLNKKLLHSFA